MKGTLNHKRRRLTHGVGINDSDYITQTTDAQGKKVVCPYFQRWKNMLRRCYSTNEHIAYEEVTVCKEWQTFSIFRAWMITQDWEGKALDKDILIPGNKEYHPDRCAFVPSKINCLLLSHDRARGEYPLGVHKRPPGREMVNDYAKPYVAECNNNGKSRYLGVFDCPMAAHREWQKCKSNVIREVVSQWEREADYISKVADCLTAIADQIDEDYAARRETVRSEDFFNNTQR